MAQSSNILRLFVSLDVVGTKLASHGGLAGLLKFSLCFGFRMTQIIFFTPNNNSPFKPNRQGEKKFPAIFGASVGVGVGVGGGSLEPSSMGL